MDDLPTLPASHEKTDGEEGRGDAQNHPDLRVDPVIGLWNKYSASGYA